VSEGANLTRDYTYVCTSRTPRDVRDALFGRKRIAFLAFFSVLLLIGLWIWVGDSLSAALPTLGGSVVGLFCMLRATSPRRWAGTLGPGVELRSSFGPDAVTTSGPLTSSTTPYTSFTELQVRGRMTMWKMRGAKMRCVVPVEIFPPAEIARVKAASDLV
jgi:hypothetical protein